MIAAENIRDWLINLAGVYAENREYLTGLDAAIGDADHGINLDRGFSAVKKELESFQTQADVRGDEESEGLSIAEILKKTASQDNDKKVQAEANYKLGKNFKEYMSNDEAISYLKKAANQDYDKIIQVQAYCALGEIYLKNNELEMAISHYTKAAEQNCSQVGSEIAG